MCRSTLTVFVNVPRPYPQQTCACTMLCPAGLYILTDPSSILVLKDGQIVEQGSHKELLAQDGVFAAMWADQISANGDPNVSIGSKKEAVSGYLEDEPAAEPNAATEEVPQEQSAPNVITVDTPEQIPGTLEPVEGDAPEPSEDKPTAPLSFPTDDTASQRAGLARQATDASGGIAFADSSPPSRTGTPDPEAETKRKRISSQNLSRFARKMSLATRRPTGSASEGTPTPQDEATPRGSSDSPNASIQGDIGGKSKKQDKKKRMSIF